MQKIKTETLEKVVGGDDRDKKQGENLSIEVQCNDCGTFTHDDGKRPLFCKNCGSILTT